MTPTLDVNTHTTTPNLAFSYFWDCHCRSSHSFVFVFFFLNFALLGGGEGGEGGLFWNKGEIAESLLLIDGSHYRMILRNTTVFWPTLTVSPSYFVIFFHKLILSLILITTPTLNGCPFLHLLFSHHFTIIVVWSFLNHLHEPVKTRRSSIEQCITLLTVNL